MTGVRLEDLPKAMQAQVRARLDLPAKRTKSRAGATRTATDGRCWTCGQRFTSTTAFERHSDSNPGHRRFELIGAKS